eukprot:s1825_g13.t1
MARAGTPELAQAIWDKTIKEVTAGTMAGPYSSEEIVAKHGRFFNVVPSFGLQQGNASDGSVKYRRIDDHTASHNNLAAHRRQKITMAMVDYLAVLVKAIGALTCQPVVLGTEDMKNAYRQIPLPDGQVAISITAIYNPSTEEPELFEIFGQPFGAGHSVPNFYRVAEWLQRALVRAFRLTLDHFFDDFYYVVQQPEATVATFCLQEGFKLLGFTLDAEKSQVPSAVAEVLGVCFCTASLAEQKQFLIAPKATRVVNLVNTIDGVLRSEQLPHALAASLLGKFGFLCSTMFGKVGRSCTGPLRDYLKSPPVSPLPGHVVLTLQLMKLLVQTAKARVCKINAPPSCYTLMLQMYQSGGQIAGS